MASHPASTPPNDRPHARDLCTLVRGGSGRAAVSIRRTAIAAAGEGAFWICSFWAVEHLARSAAGRSQEARADVRAACSYANDLGLIAEEIDPATAGQLGNFPQAYTHVGVISAALSIARAARQESKR